MKNYKEVFIDYDLTRRKFISGGALLGVSVVTAVALPNVAVAASNTVEEVENNKDEGYKLTKHIADYYKSAAL